MIRCFDILTMPDYDILRCVCDSRNLEVDGCPLKENIFGQSALLMNARYIFFPKVIYSCLLYYI